MVSEEEDSGVIYALPVAMVKELPSVDGTKLAVPDREAIVVHKLDLLLVCAADLCLLLGTSSVGWFWGGEAKV